ncbi:MAG: hypothetical protein V1911_00440 [Candidatus Micrarchaeota archaeon]
MAMSNDEIDAKIMILRNKMKSIKSHLARIELEKQVANLQEMQKNARPKENWEM